MICPKCSVLMQWVDTGVGKRTDGSPVRRGYERCPNRGCQHTTKPTEKASPTWPGRSWKMN